MSESEPIKKLKTNDLIQACRLISASITDMVARNIDQWDALYPDRQTLHDDIISGCAYGSFDKNELVTFIALNSSEPPEYRAVRWKYNGQKRLVIHRLCVDPARQGKGLAVGLLEFAENFGVSCGYSSIRLDAFVKNPRAIRLYEQNGYDLAGSVIFRKGTFNCYEKKMEVQNREIRG
jgi:ribosomal protein S18 acetylase RimI-like enzyme